MVWLGVGLEGWGGVSLNSLCRLKVQVSVYCSWRIPAHLRCTQCSTLLNLMDICIITCMCLLQISQTCLCVCRTFICLDIIRFYEEQRQPSIWFAWPTCPKTLNRVPIAGSGGFNTICTAVCDCCDSFTACMLCCLEPAQPSSFWISNISTYK